MNRAIQQIVADQRAFFHSGRTRSISFRRDALGALDSAVTRHEGRVIDALQADLEKSPYESHLTEIGFVRDEIRFARRHLKKWAAPRRVRTPLLHAPAVSRILPEPYGVALIISPWNYPFQLAIAPLIAALAAGNCIVLKPSELAPHTSAALAALVSSSFEAAHVTTIEGGPEVSQSLLEEPFDKIFFTGSTRIGRIVMAAAARHLTPATLELGGKSPCIVDRDADLGLTARRVSSGKFLNAGQTCVAPDYLMVHTDIQEALIGRIKEAVFSFFGPDPQKSPDYPRIINESHFRRLVALMARGRIRFGGKSDPADRYIAPTLLDRISGSDPVMADEIFGPILPVLPFVDLREVTRFVNARPRPLALYFFGRDHRRRKSLLESVSFGGGCINDTLLHLATPHLPFGGVGESGMGSYHGKAGFDAFSHFKSVMTRTFFPDAPLRYPPYTRFKERVLRLVLR